MDILKFYYDIFEEMPTSPDIKKDICTKRISYKSDKDFFTHLINYLGGRGYNHLLNYGKFALHMINIFRHKPFSSIDLWLLSGQYFVDRKIVDHLLFDDRHDLYQNMPCILEMFEMGLTQETIKIMYEKISDALIDCIMFDSNEKDYSVGR